MDLARLILGLNAAVVGLVGVAYLADPNLFLSNYSLTADSPGMDNMLRSSYGGLFLAVACVLGVGANRAPRRRDALIVLALFMGGLAFGRVVSVVMVGAPGAPINLLLAYEIAMASIALILIWRIVPSSNH